MQKDGLDLWLRIVYLIDQTRKLITQDAGIQSRSNHCKGIEMTAKGPRLTRAQAKTLLVRQQQLHYTSPGYTPSRAYRVFRAYQLTLNENGRTKHRQFTISGPPTQQVADLTRWNKNYRLVAVVPCTNGWRVILSPIPIDPACWV